MTDPTTSHPEPPLQLAARALVLDEHNRLLLVSHDPAYWYTPGGRTNLHESLRAGARREVYEETGLWVTVERLVFVDELVDPERGKHIVECYFLAKTADELPAQWTDTGGPVTQARFFSRAEIPHLPRVYPTYLHDTFWRLLEHNFIDYDPYRQLSADV